MTHFFFSDRLLTLSIEPFNHLKPHLIGTVCPVLSLSFLCLSHLSLPVLQPDGASNYILKYANYIIMLIYADASTVHSVYT